jgi:hypothetical protein
VDLDSLFELFKALSDEGAEYVLVGGVALNLLGIVRATEDVDLFIRTDASNVEKVKAALRRVWHDTEIEQISADDLAGDYPVVRYGPPDGDIVVDLISRLGTAVTFDDLEWDVIDVDGVGVRVATADTLYRMKKDTVRPVDRADAEAIRRAFGPREE